MPASRTTTCCIVGGGPAGIMLGFLLARAGVDVVVLEKHADFFRDFRGDTIHPSTLELLYELGLLDEFLKLPHQQFSKLTVAFGDRIVDGPDFSHLPTHCKFIALAPQWDFLNFLASHAQHFPTFQLLMQTTATGLLEGDGRVRGVRCETANGELEILADLVVAADGRHSTIRDGGHFQLDEYGVPIDVLWYRLPKSPDDREQTHALGRIRDGQAMVTLDRGDYYQCGTIIPKGGFEPIQAHGLPAFRQQIVALAPFLQGSVEDLQSWDQIRLLTVQINRLRTWQRPGLLCIGDAAHAMSPAGGVGVNVAIQDAVATANLLADKLRAGQVTLADLQAVQRRREWPAKMTQRLQAFIHRRMFSQRGGQPRFFDLSAPAQGLIRLAGPVLRHIAARIIGMGFRPEHVRTRERLK